MGGGRRGSTPHVLPALLRLTLSELPSTTSARLPRVSGAGMPAGLLRLLKPEHSLPPPSSLLYATGYFAFMACESLPGSQLWDRSLLLLTDPQRRPRLLETGHAPYLETVPFRSVAAPFLLLFTVVLQLLLPLSAAACRCSGTWEMGRRVRRVLGGGHASFRCACCKLGSGCGAGCCLALPPCSHVPAPSPTLAGCRLAPPPPSPAAQHDSVVHRFPAGLPPGGLRDNLGWRGRVRLRV